MSSNQTTLTTTPPTTTQITTTEKELADLIEKKKQLELNLISLEVQIHQRETAYLTDAQQYGDLLKGLSGYLSKPPVTARKAGPAEISPGDRVFSSTSATYQKALCINDRLAMKQ